MSRIVLEVMFVSGSIVSNSANDFFGVVATRQGTFCVGPVVLGLAQCTALSRIPGGMFLMLVAGSLR